MGKIESVTADQGKLKLWYYNKYSVVGTLAVESSNPKKIAEALKTYGYYEVLRKSSSFDFGEESGFKTDDEPSNILNKAFEIVIGKGE